MSKIPYDLGKIKAVICDIDGVLSPSTVPMDPDGEPQRMVNVKDGYSLLLAVRYGLRIAIISGARTPYVANRFRILGIEDVFLNTLDKVPVLRRWMADRNLAPEEVAYIGDDLPDLGPMAIVGLPIAPADADTTVKTRALYITVAKGGQGAVREVVEQIMIYRGDWQKEIDRICAEVTQ